MNSDHDLIMLTWKLKLRKIMRNHGPRIKLNLEKLNEPQVADLFEATIAGTFAVVNLLEPNIDSFTEDIDGTLVYIASEVLGNARKKTKPWRLVTFRINVT